MRQSTLPNRQWAVPLASVVPSSAMWTEAEATAGVSPTLSSSVVEVTPYPMPSAPSTSWATNPMSPTITIPVPRPIGLRPLALLSSD